jgi:hypothetical protein
MLQKRRGGRAGLTRFTTDLHSIHHVPLIVHTVNINITRARTLEDITSGLALRVLESSLISVPKIFNCNWPMTRSALLRNDMSDGNGDASAESRGTKIKGRVEKLPDRLPSLFMMTFQLQLFMMTFQVQPLDV